MPKHDSPSALILEAAIAGTTNKVVLRTQLLCHHALARTTPGLTAIGRKPAEATPGSPDTGTGNHLATPFRTAASTTPTKTARTTGTVSKVFDRAFDQNRNRSFGQRRSQEGGFSQGQTLSLRQNQDRSRGSVNHSFSQGNNLDQGQSYRQDNTDVNGHANR